MSKFYQLWFYGNSDVRQSWELLNLQQRTKNMILCKKQKDVYLEIKQQVLINCNVQVNYNNSSLHL